MKIDIVKLNSQGAQLLEDFVKKMGIEGAILATSEGLEMASYFTDNNRDADLIAADSASMLSVISGMLENTDKGNLKEMIISAEKGSIAVKDLGDDIALAVLAPENYKMGGLIVALKTFTKEVQEF
jgi:predicted regulator of Ras-like GTPase activity (Roadblock/LC7/MglB family)